MAIIKNNNCSSRWRQQGRHLRHSIQMPSCHLLIVVVLFGLLCCVVFAPHKAEAQSYELSYVEDEPAYLSGGRILQQAANDVRNEAYLTQANERQESSPLERATKIGRLSVGLRGRSNSLLANGRGGKFKRIVPGKWRRYQSLVLDDGAANESSFLENNAISMLQKRAERQPAYMMSPLSDQVLQLSSELLGRQASSQQQRDHMNLNLIDLAGRYRAAIKPQILLQDLNECNTLRSEVQLSRDDVDLVRGQLVRSCKGLVQLNRCEGSCTSTVQPSIKSQFGLQKDCSCCNEGSFKRVQVRLNECYSAVGNRRITSNENEQKSYMDIEVEEPIDCKCRRCDGIA